MNWQYVIMCIWKTACLSYTVQFTYTWYNRVKFDCTKHAHRKTTTRLRFELLMGGPYIALIISSYRSTVMSIMGKKCYITKLYCICKTEITVWLNYIADVYNNSCYLPVRFWIYSELYYSRIQWIWEVKYLSCVVSVIVYTVWSCVSTIEVFMLHIISWKPIFPFNFQRSTCLREPQHGWVQ